MTAVFKREFRAFFTSPVGYVVMAVLFCFSGWFFFLYNLASGSADMSSVFGNLFTIVLLLVLPILTMRLFSEEKRQKTDQALLTAPTSLTGIVVGKFLSALLMFAIGLSITIVYAVVIAVQVTPDWMVIIGNVVGLLLMSDNLKYLFNASWLAAIVDFLSISQRYNDFTIGVIHYDDILFFLSMQVLFLFLTVRVLDRKRWS